MEIAPGEAALPLCLEQMPQFTLFNQFFCVCVFFFKQLSIKMLRQQDQAHRKPWAVPHYHCLQSRNLYPSSLPNKLNSLTEKKFHATLTGEII